MRITEVRLPAHELTGQRRLYGELLGLPVVAESAAELQFQVGQTRLIFEASLAPVVAQHFAINIPGNQFEAAADWLARRVPLLSDEQGATRFEFHEWQAQSVYFRDAAGHLAELIARRSVDATQPGPFGSASLLNVSEVGVVTDDPARVAAELAAHGLRPYRSSSPDFIPVGDEQGLLIVVRAGRGWFPVGEAAASGSFSAQLTRPDGTGLRLDGATARLLPL